MGSEGINEIEYFETRIWFGINSSICILNFHLSGTFLWNNIRSGRNNILIRLKTFFQVISHLESDNLNLVVISFINTMQSYILKAFWGQ